MWHPLTEWLKTFDWTIVQPTGGINQLTMAATSRGLKWRLHSRMKQDTISAARAPTLTRKLVASRLPAPKCFARRNARLKGACRNFAPLCDPEARFLPPRPLPVAQHLGYSADPYGAPRLRASLRKRCMTTILAPTLSQQEPRRRTGTTTKSPTRRAGASGCPTTSLTSWL